jgi:predicted nuclease of predicted toxin-antitoxin system
VTSFLVDQQLPRALATFLVERGHDARHIKEYNGGTTMPDRDIARLADSEDRCAVTKDDDFRISHLLGKPPAQLLHVTCGNISTRDLLVLFDQRGPRSTPPSRPTSTWRSTARACSSTTATLTPCLPCPRSATAATNCAAAIERKKAARRRPARRNSGWS